MLIVYYVVLAELFYLLDKYGQTPLFEPFLQDLQALPYFRIEPIDFMDIQNLGDCTEVAEMHDRLIVIAANRLGATLVTRDKNIQTSNKVSWIW